MLLILLAMKSKYFDILDCGTAAYHFGKSTIMCAHKSILVILHKACEIRYLKKYWCFHQRNKRSPTIKHKAKNVNHKSCEIEYFRKYWRIKKSPSASRILSSNTTSSGNLTLLKEGFYHMYVYQTRCISIQTYI